MDETFVKRVLPHSIEAEQSVIGSMLYSPEAIQTASEMLRGEDFYQHQYGVLFDTMMELYQGGRPTDIVTLQDALKTKDVAPEVYSLDFLKDLLNASFISANIRSYAQIVADKAMLRRTIRTLEEITNSCYLGKEKTSEIMSDTEKKIFDLLESREAGGGAETVDNTVLRVIERIEGGVAVNAVPGLAQATLKAVDDMPVHEGEGALQQRPVEIQGGKIQAEAVRLPELQGAVQLLRPGQNGLVPVAAHGLDPQLIPQQAHGGAVAAAHVQYPVPGLPAGRPGRLSGKVLPAGVESKACFHRFTPEYLQYRPAPAPW